MRVGLFGSYARGDTHEKSDVDILIDYLTIPGLMQSTNETFKQEVLREVRWIYNPIHNTKEKTPC